MDNRERKNIAPCGKCGGTGTLKVCIEQRKKKFYVHCINCGYISERKDTIDEAKAEWNKQGAYANEEYLEELKNVDENFARQEEQAEELLMKILNQ